MVIGPGETIIALTSIILGVGITALFIIKFTGLIKYWIDRRSGSKVSGEAGGRLASLEKLVSRLEKRIQNLETIIVDNDMGLPETNPDEVMQKSERSGHLQNNLR